MDRDSITRTGATSLSESPLSARPFCQVGKRYTVPQTTKSSVGEGDMLNRTLATFLAFSVIGVLAQGIRATLVGRVTDESGAIVPHAKITIVNSGTNETRILIASDSGEFTFAQLPPGD